MNPTHALRTLLAERLGRTAGRWPRELFGDAVDASPQSSSLRQALRQRSDGITVTREPDLNGEAYYVARTPDGGFAGHVSVLTDAKTGVRYPEDIMVRPDLLRRGIATDLMAAVRGDFGDIAPSSLTDDGRALWTSIGPAAPNAGPRGNGSTLAGLAALPASALTLRELLRDRYEAA